MYDGMKSHDVSMNIALLKKGNNNPNLFVENSIINQNQVIDNLINWQEDINSVDN